MIINHDDFLIIARSKDRLAALSKIDGVVYEGEYRKFKSSGGTLFEVQSPSMLNVDECKYSGISNSGLPIWMIHRSLDNAGYLANQIFISVLSDAVESIHSSIVENVYQYKIVDEENPQIVYEWITCEHAKYAEILHYITRGNNYTTRVLVPVSSLDH